MLARFIQSKGHTLDLSQRFLFSQCFLWHYLHGRRATLRQIHRTAVTYSTKAMKYLYSDPNIINFKGKSNVPNLKVNLKFLHHKLFFRIQLGKHEKQKWHYAGKIVQL